MDATANGGDLVGRSGAISLRFRAASARRTGAPVHAHPRGLTVVARVANTTPPGGPGEHPEIVSPQYALGHDIEGGMLGTSDDLDALQREIGQQAE